MTPTPKMTGAYGMREEEEMGSSQSSGAVPSSPQEATRDILRCALRVTPQQATILETLYRRRRHVMPQSLAIRLDRIDHATEPSLFGIKVQVCNLRKTLGRDVIESKPHRNYFEGYRLTPKGRALIEAVLGETA